MDISGYLIDKEIIFLPEKKIIKSIKTDKTQVLHSPATRCFQLLIDRKTIVPQAELYKVGWGEDALKTVSTATYYQCFVNLRRQIREIGYDSELLLTIPKEGMRINHEVEITLLPSPLDKDHNNKLNLIKNHPLITITLVITLSLVMILLSAYFFRDRTISTTDFEKYVHLPQIAPCIYAYLEYSDDSSIKSLNTFINEQGFTCKAQRNLYFYQGPVHYTVFDCPKNMHCISYTYLM